MRSLRGQRGRVSSSGAAERARRVAYLAQERTVAWNLGAGDVAALGSSAGAHRRVIEALAEMQAEALTDRGINKHLVVNAESGRLGDTDLAADDLAANICPVGVILKKRVGFATAIGDRTYDVKPIHIVAMEDEK